MLTSLLLKLPQPYRFKTFFWIERVKVAAGRLRRCKVVCGDCDHFFDPADERAFMPSTDPETRKFYGELTPSCPACNQMSNGAKAWAVHNDCQGVFTDMMHHSRADAVKEAETFSKEFGAFVAPVRIITEPESDWWKRDYDEREREKYE